MTVRKTITIPKEAYKIGYAEAKVIAHKEGASKPNFSRYISLLIIRDKHSRRPA